MFKNVLLFAVAAMVLQSSAAGKYDMEFCGKRTRIFENQKEITFADCVKEQFSLREKSQLRDLIKQAYQGAYGAGHGVVDKTRAYRYFSKEFDAVPAEKTELFEIISPDYCRINLAAWKAAKLPKEWLFNMFCASTEIFPDSEEIFQKYLKDITGNFPQFKAEMAEFMKKYKGGAVHHSKTYRKLYHPSYRIVSTRFLTVLPVLKAAAALPGNGVKIIAIDGRAASGKTTVAGQLAKILKAGVVHMDDFFLPQDLRTAKRFAEAGGNVHYERFKAEVLPDLRKESGFAYRRFDCSKMAPGEMRQIAATRWRVVEGAYSLHPEFGNYADLKIFFDITPAEQMKRIKKRNGGEKAKIFASRWIPLEENYIKQTGVKKRADIILGR